MTFFTAKHLPDAATSRAEYTNEYPPSATSPVVNTCTSGPPFPSNVISFPAELELRLLIEASSHDIESRIRDAVASARRPSTEEDTFCFSGDSFGAALDI
eukprot:scaffold12965_cov241-Isochrysis_galbana.AAC.7